MTTTELKAHIHKMLEDAPEDTLSEVLNLLQHLKEQPTQNAKLAIHLKQILSEDKELLQKLAQ